MNFRIKKMNRKLNIFSYFLKFQFKMPLASKKRKISTEPISFTHPQLLREWHHQRNNPLGHDPNKLTYGSHKKVWWKCQNNEEHEWQSRISDRSDEHGCPYCSGRKACEDNCLANNDPFGICEEWHYEKNVYIKNGQDVKLTPNDVTKSSGVKVWWKCKGCGREWQATVHGRSKGHGCPQCKYLSNNNRLANNDPLGICEEWHHEKNVYVKEGQKHDGVSNLNSSNLGQDVNLTPNDVTKSSRAKVWWKCKAKGHEWQATIYGRSRGDGCPYCYKESRKK